MVLPHWAHALSTEVDSDDDKLAAVTDFDDDFTSDPFERGTLDDVLSFSRCTVSLTLDDLAREDDVFKIEDGEVVIVKFVRGMGGNDVAERTDQMAKVGYVHLGHAQVYGRPTAPLMPGLLPSAGGVPTAPDSEA